MDFPGGKVDGVSTLSAADYNQTVGLNNAISSTGQTPSSSDLNQLAKSMAHYGAGNFYSDSGVANAYSLSMIGSAQTPAAYFDGMEIRFRAANQSTGASTITVGALGSKAIKQADGVTDITTEISTTADSVLRFDSANDCFVYDVGISAATTTVTGISLLPTPITLKNNIVDANNDIDFTAGVMQFDDGSGQAATTAITKQLDANFVAGTNQGGLDTGAKAADTWYYCYTIYNPSTGATDALFTSTYGSPTMPTGFTKKAYRGALLTDVLSNIIVGTYDYRPDGSYRFMFDIELMNFNSSPPATSTAVTVSAPIDKEAILNITYLDNDSNSGYIIFREEGQTDIAPNQSSNATIIGDNGSYGKVPNYHINARSNQRIFIRGNDVNATIFTITTRGFVDNII
jgi:hypothetical protein